ncbi:TPA: hypothetical protein ACPZPM_004114 [Yersinia enterocolitica]
MIDISSAKIEKLIVHRVGNKIREEGYKLSSNEAKINDHLNDLFLKHYLLPLSKIDSCFQFYHESDITLNEIHQFTSRIFFNPSSFQEQSVNIAKHLYSASTHPNIAGGDFIIILFSEIKLNDISSYGIAILKIESKDDYLDIKDNAGIFQPHERTGISLNKIQKGALIISDTKTIYVIDNLGQKTKYWLDSFLKVVPLKTQRSCTKAGGEILKSISSKIDDTSMSLNLNKEVEKKIKSSPKISIKEIKDIAAKFLNIEKMDTVFSSVREKFGFDLSDDIEIESHDLEKYTKKTTRKTKIDDGVNLIITNPTHQVDKISVKKSESGLQALIDISIKGE